MWYINRPRFIFRKLFRYWSKNWIIYIRMLRRWLCVIKFFRWKTCKINKFDHVLSRSRTFDGRRWIIRTWPWRLWWSWSFRRRRCQKTMWGIGLDFVLMDWYHQQRPWSRKSHDFWTGTWRLPSFELQFWVFGCSKRFDDHAQNGDLTICCFLKTTREQKIDGKRYILCLYFERAGIWTFDFQHMSYLFG